MRRQTTRRTRSRGRIGPIMGASTGALLAMLLLGSASSALADDDLRRPVIRAQPRGLEVHPRPVSAPALPSPEPPPTPRPSTQPAPPPADPCPITAAGDFAVDPGRDRFPAWLAAFRRQAAECGITKATLASALDGLGHDARIAGLDRKQAEFNSTFSGYLQTRIGSGLVSQGQARLKRWRTLLAGLDDRYGVPPEVMVALWGLESAFGQVTGDTPTIRALATLAYDGRRRGFYQRELLAALRLIDAGHNDARMRGSWAGAMGQPQFMPTTFQAHALDGDGDDRFDIWGSVPDALTSAANYLAAIHWRAGQPWGREVRLPAGFDAYQARLPLRLADADWAAQGVGAADGGALTDLGLSGSIILPAGIHGPAFLVYDNFRVITEWNRSIFYGLTVGILSDRLAGRPGLIGRAPPGEQRLRRSAVFDLQEALNRQGYDAGTPDGMIGMQTRQALRDFQRDRNLVPDAYPSPETIAALHGRPAPNPKPDLTSVDVLALQRGLNARGYDAGAEDGLWGGQTRRAFDAWLDEQGLGPGSAPTPALIRRVAAPPTGDVQGRHLEPRLLTPRGLD